MKHFFGKSNKTGSRLLAFLLSVVMLLSMTMTMKPSVTAAAPVMTDAETKQNLDTTKEVLSDLADSFDVPGTKIVTNLLFNSIFGSQDNAIELALQKLSEQLGQIQSQMTNLANQIKNESVKQYFLNRINGYITQTAQYMTIYINFLATEKRISALPVSAERDSEAEAFLDEINTIQIDGKDFHSAVQALGENILSSDASGTRDLFDTYDGLVKYSFKWEHQGYNSRRAFQAHTLSLYTGLVSFSILGLSAKIDEKETAGQPTAVDKGTLDSLKEQIKQIDELAEYYTVTELPSDERYYQVPGHERLLKAVAVDRTLNPTFPGRPSYWIEKKDLENRVLNYNGKAYSYPSPDWFKNVYLDYNGTKDLNQIFFDSDFGGLTAPSGIPLNSYTVYLTNEHHQDKTRYDSRFGYTREGYFIMVASPNGTVSDRWICDVNLTGSLISAIEDWMNIQMMAVIDITPIMVQVPSGITIPEISGIMNSYKAPYSKDIVLSVEDLGEFYGYQWQVDKQDGSGFSPIVGADDTSYLISSVDATMNGYKYRCVITLYDLSGSATSEVTDPVTLNLVTGNSINSLIILLSVILVVCISVVVLVILIKRKRKA